MVAYLSDYGFSGSGAGRRYVVRPARSPLADPGGPGGPGQGHAAADPAAAGIDGEVGDIKDTV